MRVTLGVIGALVLTAACTRSGRDHEQALDRLSDRLQTRPHEGRLRAGRWRPFISSQSDLLNRLDASAVEAYASLRRAAAIDRTPQTLLAAGLGELLAGEPSIARVELSEAVALAPESAEAWNALAVAYLAEPADTSLEATVRAYDAASTAAGLVNDDPAALFNMAVAASRLGLSEEAHLWRQVLSRERDAQWRAEIDARRTTLPRAGSSTPQAIAARVRGAGAEIGALSAELVAFDPQNTREAAFEWLFPEWGAGVLADDRRSSDRLQALGTIAGVLADRERDPLLADCVRSASSDRSVDRRFARGMVAFGAGRAHQRQTRIEDAQDQFRNALAHFERSGAAALGCAAMARAALGHAIYQVAGPADALDHLQRALGVARARGYPSLTARIDWLLALAHVGNAEPAKAIAAYERALAGYGRTGESANLCSVARGSADLLRLQGEWMSAWPRLSVTLRCAAGDSDPLRRYLAFFEASLFASDAALPRAALAFQQEAVAAAMERKADVTIAEGFTRRAMLHARVGSEADARADLARAREAVSRIASPGMSAYQRAWTARVDAELAVRAEPHRVPGILDEGVIDLFASLEPTEIPRIRLARARAFRQVGNDRAAERELVEGLRLVRRHVSRLEGEDQRLSYAEAEWDLAAEMVRILVDRGQYHEALQHAHQRAGEPPPFGRHVCTARADGAQIYAFVSLPRELLRFACRGNELVVTRSAQPSAVIEGQIQTYRRLLRADAHRDAAAAAGQRLYRLLFAGMPPAPGARLLVIPDGVFGLMPYASLIDPGSGRFLIEDHDVALLTTAGPRRAARDVSDGIVLVAPGAGPPLPRVLDEVKHVAGVYERSTVLAGADATAGALRRTMPAGRVVHFAGHAKANPGLPWASYLSVTPDLDRPEGRVEAAEIVGWPLSSTELVVLSSCESVAPRTTRGDSLVGLAKAFLRAGSRSVVGSLWEIEDDSTSQLMASFHRANRETRDPIKALRQAQLQLLRGADPSDRLPRNWAGFIAVTASR